MGGYLSEPIREKESSDYEGEGLICGASSMQGWRATQEDAHNCYMKYDEIGSLFAVYDGHGGHEVAEYAAKHLPNYIKGTDAYKAGDYEKALIDAFLGFDATLASPDVITVLKKIAGSKESDVKPDGEAKSKSLEMDEDDDDDEDEEESLEHLRKEAHMPLDQLIDRYRQENKGNFKFVSPNCSRTKKAGGAGPSTSAAASSSCESNGADGEVSSSSGSSKVLTNGDIDVNGDISDEVNGESSEAGSSGDKCNGETAVKKTDAAGGSSSSGSSSSEIAAASSGSSAKDDLPDSSSQSQSEDKNVSSSNGEVNDDKLSSSSPNSKEFGKRSVTLTRKLLCSPGEDSDSDSDDENFEGEAQESDDDEDGGEVEGEEDEDEEDEECEEEEEEDEEDEEGEEDVEFDYGMQHSDEPGSDSGCTAVVALLKGKDLFVANAGDSRCVVCRDGQAIEMSIDHKPEDQIEKDRIMAAGGKVSKDGRVNGGLNLSRALGDHTYKQVTSLPATEQMITALPDIKKLEIDPVKDEFIVLACDGIWNFMSSQDVVDFIRPRLNEKREKISTICEELFDHCLAPDTEGDGTGCDNMTCIIVQLKPVSLNGHESVKKRLASTLEEDVKDNKEEVSSKRQKIESEKPETAPETTPVTV